MTPKDLELLGLLRLNAREPVAVLARKLGLSRTTVQDRLRRLEASGAIAGYTVRLGGEGPSGGIAALISLGVEPKKQADVAKALGRIAQVETVHTVSGKFDFVAHVRAQSADAIDKLIDQMTELSGVTDVETAVILSTKVDRR